MGGLLIFGCCEPFNLDLGQSFQSLCLDCVVGGRWGFGLIGFADDYSKNQRGSQCRRIRPEKDFIRKALLRWAIVLCLFQQYAYSVGDWVCRTVFQRFID